MDWKKFRRQNGLRLQTRLQLVNGNNEEKRSEKAWEEGREKRCITEKKKIPKANPSKLRTHIAKEKSQGVRTSIGKEEKPTCTQEAPWQKDGTGGTVSSH